jgi:hypothetical protein
MIPENPQTLQMADFAVPPFEIAEYGLGYTGTDKDLLNLRI